MDFALVHDASEGFSALRAYRTVQPVLQGLAR